MARRFGDGIGKFLTELVDPRPAISDAYWAFTHPRDRIMGRGRAANGQMAFPLGGRWAPKTPGLRAEALERGDDWIDYMGDRAPFKAKGEYTTHDGRWIEEPPEWQGALRRGYNLRNEKNEIVASGDRLMGSASRGGGRLGNSKRGDHVYVPSVWVREDYRKTGAARDLENLITHGGKFKPVGAYANDRLEAIMARRFDPERLKTLKAVAKVSDRRAASATRRGLSEPTQWRGSPSQLDNDIRKLRIEVEAGRGRQVTNRDIGHPLTPVRRPPTPRPARQRIMGLREQQAALSQELRNRRRGGV